MPHLVSCASSIDHAFVIQGIAKSQNPRAHIPGAVQYEVSAHYLSTPIAGAGLPLLPDGFSHEACVPAPGCSGVSFCCCLPSLQSLAYHSSLYCRAQAMRKDGKTPANHGVVDDLPVRLAAEQLHTLAGMSQKVGLGVRTGLLQRELRALAGILQEMPAHKDGTTSACGCHMGGHTCTDPGGGYAPGFSQSQRLIQSPCASPGLPANTCAVLACVHDDWWQPAMPPELCLSTLGLQQPCLGLCSSPI